MQTGEKEMKKIIALFLSLLLLVSCFLVGCSNKVNYNEDAATGSDAKNDIVSQMNALLETQQNTQLNTDLKTSLDLGTGSNSDGYVVKERYLPLRVSKGMKNYLENTTTAFNGFTYGSAPFVMQDVYTISDCRLLSISIPVLGTGATDANGDLIFTMFVVKNGLKAMSETPRAEYTIKINAAAHGLEANRAAARKWIKVDIKDYNIVLAENETLAFGKSGDTIQPAYLPSGESATNPAQMLASNEFPQMMGHFSNVGKGTAVSGTNQILIFDFEWERIYDNYAEYKAEQAAEAEYQKLLAAVKEQYKGKKLSILGDSISTYGGISNSASFNTTISGNAVYYHAYSGTAINENTVKKVDMDGETYWGRLLNDLGMTLCVDNAWSGSRVFEPTYGAGTVKNIVSRASNLHQNANGKSATPDVIIFYMGINDANNVGPFGSLYNLLTDTSDTRTNNEKITEWLKGFSESNFSDFEQAYAMALKTMRTQYPNAEVWCMTLCPNNAYTAAFAPANDKLSQIRMYNFCITALANYYGCGVVDQQQGYITYDNCHAFNGDGSAGGTAALHPNVVGHALMEKLIVETFYDKMKKA